jgi:hypothetical protein
VIEKHRFQRRFPHSAYMDAERALVQHPSYASAQRQEPGGGGNRAT